jgi:hypothetical protein
MALGAGLLQFGYALFWLSAARIGTRQVAILKPESFPQPWEYPNLENRSEAGYARRGSQGTELEATEKRAELQEQWLAGR